MPQMMPMNWFILFLSFLLLFILFLSFCFNLNHLLPPKLNLLSINLNQMLWLW